MSTELDIAAWCRHVKMQHLRTVLTVAQTTSLALAAELMGLSQPAVTKILQEVEADLDVKLFVRTSRGTRCTPAGEVMVSHVRLIFAQLEQTARAIHDSRAGLSGRVVVGALIAGAAWLLPRAVATLQASRPGVRVTIIEGTYDYLTPLLRQGALDMIVGRLPKHEYRDGLDVISMYQEKVTLVVRPGHPALALKRPGLKALSAWPWILPLSGTTLRDLLESAFHDLMLELPDARVESVSVVSNRRLILDSDYICSFPWDVVELEVEHGLLCRLHPKQALSFGPVGASLRKQGAPSLAAEALLEALRAVAKDKKRS